MANSLELKMKECKEGDIIDGRFIERELVIKPLEADRKLLTIKRGKDAEIERLVYDFNSTVTISIETVKFGDPKYDEYDTKLSGAKL